MAKNNFCLDISIEDLYNPMRLLSHYNGHPSKYCLAYLTEGRKQIFDYNSGKSFVFLHGFAEWEYDSLNSSFIWSIRKSSTIMILETAFKSEIIINYDCGLLQDTLVGNAHFIL